MTRSYSYPTTIYERILAQKYVFLVLFTIFAFYHEFFISKNGRKKNYKKYVYLGENTFIHCSWITVVHVHVNVFL